MLHHYKFEFHEEIHVIQDSAIMGECRGDELVKIGNVTWVLFASQIQPHKLAFDFFPEVPSIV